MEGSLPLLRTYTNTYLSTSAYTSLYIFNRLLTSTVTGEDRGTVEPNDSLKFATYTRDTATGLDADQRYYANIWGRFIRPDPSGRSLVMTNPER